MKLYVAKGNNCIRNNWKEKKIVCFCSNLWLSFKWVLEGESSLLEAPREFPKNF